MLRNKNPQCNYGIIQMGGGQKNLNTVARVLQKTPYSSI